MLPLPFVAVFPCHATFARLQIIVWGICGCHPKDPLNGLRFRKRQELVGSYHFRLNSYTLEEGRQKEEGRGQKGKKS